MLFLKTVILSLLVLIPHELFAQQILENFNILNPTHIYEISGKGAPTPPYEYPEPNPYPIPTPEEPGPPHPAPYPGEPRPPQRPAPHIGLYIQNNCYDDIGLALRYSDLNGQWINRGFYTVPRGRVIHIANMNREFYYLYAFTADHSRVWQGVHDVELNGILFPAVLVTLPNYYRGNWTTVLYCY